MTPEGISEDVCGTTPFYWRAVEKVEENYNSKIQSEENLIFQSYLPLPKSNFGVIIGMSPARDFLPTVKLIDNVSHKYVTFISCDWRDFVEHLSSNNSSYDGINFRITYVDDPGTDIVVVVETIENSICLSDKCIEELTAIHLLIDYRLRFIQDLNFVEFYENALEYINALPATSSRDDIEHLKDICHLNTNVNSYCLLECIEYEMSKIVNDLDRLYMNNIDESM